LDLRGYQYHHGGGAHQRENATGLQANFLPQTRTPHSAAKSRAVKVVSQQQPTAQPVDRKHRKYQHLSTFFPEEYDPASLLQTPRHGQAATRSVISAG
ncbi:unnamed protein product, partial [Amoebophrya sp. A120]